jgi:hypothetical protein
MRLHIHNIAGDKKFNPFITKHGLKLVNLRSLCLCQKEVMAKSSPLPLKKMFIDSQLNIVTIAKYK